MKRIFYCRLLQERFAHECVETLFFAFCAIRIDKNAFFYYKL